MITYEQPQTFKVRYTVIPAPGDKDSSPKNETRQFSAMSWAAARQQWDDWKAKHPAPDGARYRLIYVRVVPSSQ